MDNRRLILLLVFSFSLVMLWDGWQKHNAPATQLAGAVKQISDTPQPSMPSLADVHNPSAPGLPVAHFWWQCNTCESNG